MEMCHLTYSYTFTPRAYQVMAACGLDLTQGPDDNGLLVCDLWLNSQTGLFCSRFIEIIDERHLPQHEPRKEFPLWPDFAQNLPQPVPKHSPHFTLEGFLVEDQVAAKERISRLDLPASVYFRNRETALEQQLSYKKISPYWALLIRPLTTHARPPLSNDISAIRWDGQEALWLQLETTCWDIIIT
nr:hypothetical protein BdHM001_07600 [Bdellovibrio sp. HM001]